MDITIKTIEDLSLNACPSHQIQVYDPRQIPIRVIGRVMEVRKRF